MIIEESFFKYNIILSMKKIKTRVCNKQKWNAKNILEVIAYRVYSMPSRRI